MKSGIVIKTRIAMDLKSSKGSCRLTISAPLSFSQRYSLVLSKFSQFSAFIDQRCTYFIIKIKQNIKKMVSLFRLMQSLEVGLVPYWFSKHTPNIDKCRVDIEKPQGKIKSIKLYDMASAFLVIGFGVALSFLAFLLEIIHHHFPFIFRFMNNILKRFNYYH